jgi:ABC-type phosphate/phosphonate transport system substrate-binding protein
MDGMALPPIGCLYHYLFFFYIVFLPKFIIDFFWSNPHLTSCVATETGAVTLANEIRVDLSNITSAAAALYTLTNRTDITDVSDVEGKIIGTNKLTNLATHLCYDVLLRNGLHHMNSPKQTVFFEHSNDALAALLDGRVDVACGAIGTLEKYVVNETTGETLNIDRDIRILNPQRYELVDSGSENGDRVDEGLNHYKISSQLVSQSPFMALPHVETVVKRRVQEELLNMASHADIMLALVACLHDSGRGCLSDPQNTSLIEDLIMKTAECVQACFQELVSTGIVTRCDTTPERAFLASNALAIRDLSGFKLPLNNFKIRDIQETTGFLIKPPTFERTISATIPTASPSYSLSLTDNAHPYCVRINNIVEAVTCPPGHFARSSQDIIQQCNVSGLDCYDRQCICSPCVKAFEVRDSALFAIYAYLFVCLVDTVWPGG